jgi:hypothetical protein
MAVLERPQRGQRVELEGNPIGITLTSRTGRIVREDEWDGYYIVRLDGPAYYQQANGETVTLFEIREAEDNLHALPEPW